MKILLVLILVLFTAGCLEQPVNSVTIPGHNVEYIFSSNLREAILVPVNDEDIIRNLSLENKRINIVFDGSDRQDNGMISVSLFDITHKLTTYFLLENISKEFAIYYYIDDQWYDVNSNETAKPELNKEGESTLWVLGPATGATETSV